MPANFTVLGINHNFLQVEVFGTNQKIVDSLLSRLGIISRFERGCFLIFMRRKSPVTAIVATVNWQKDMLAIPATVPEWLQTTHTPKAALFRARAERIQANGQTFRRAKQEMQAMGNQREIRAAQSCSGRKTQQSNGGITFFLTGLTTKKFARQIIQGEHATFFRRQNVSDLSYEGRFSQICVEKASRRVWMLPLRAVHSRIRHKEGRNLA